MLQLWVYHLPNGTQAKEGISGDAEEAGLPCFALPLGWVSSRPRNDFSWRLGNPAFSLRIPVAGQSQAICMVSSVLGRGPCHPLAWPRPRLPFVLLPTPRSVSSPLMLQLGYKEADGSGVLFPAPPAEVWCVATVSELKPNNWALVMAMLKTYIYAEAEGTEPKWQGLI